MSQHGHDQPCLRLQDILPRAVIEYLILQFNIHFCALNSTVARGNHTYYMACCLPGVQSRKAITPVANKYPEDLQYPGYLHFMTHVCVL